MVQRLAKDLMIQPGAVAAIVCSHDGKIKTMTSQHAVGAERR
jgi:hypothetical protein